ncbi:MAG: hypothetical protein R3288_13215 [Woeseiaceae bacterium]|nr:hypothetical protein [Woeseiaceae bacterium]
MTQAERDLAYVQDVVREAELSTASPRSIYFLWAVIYLVGFSLYDFAPQHAGLFWMIAGPGGGIVSYWLGYRWATRTGVQSRRDAMRHLWHWIGMAAAIFMSVGLLYTGAISSTTLAKIVLLMVAFGLYTAGIYLVRPYLWIGVALGLCFVGLLTIETLSWVVVGVVSGGAMFVAGLFSHRSA